MRNVHRIVALTFLALGSGITLAGDPPAPDKAEGVGLTIYNQGFAVVKARRKLTLQAGVQELMFQDVAATIDATSVKFESLTDPVGTRVLEQNFQYDLVNSQKLLQKYLDREIGFEVMNEKDKVLERKTGTLLSTQGIVKMAGEIRLNFPGSVILPALPEGLITRPTLQWKLDAAKAGEHLAKVTYQARGIGWTADYTLIAKKDDTLADLSGWVTINNQSGATYTDATIKLMAGDVHRVQATRPSHDEGLGVTQNWGGKSGGFEEKSFAEYHLYTLGRPATVKESETKQIELLGATDVASRKVYRYDAAMDAKKVRVLLGLKNDKASRLGMPLPAGKVRIYKMDEADGTLEFIGEDRIDHTAKDEKLELYVGDAFDIVGEQVQTNNRQSGRHQWASFKVSVRNHKDTAVTVEVMAHPGAWGNWEIEKNTDAFEKQDAGTVVFKVEIPKDGEKVIEYTLHAWSE